MKKSILVMMMAVLVGACSASTADTNLVLKPTAAQLAAAQPATNRICPVSRDSIGAMGEGVKVIWKGQTVLLCCPGCVKSFAKDPAKLVASLKEEKAK